LRTLQQAILLLNGTPSSEKKPVADLKNFRPLAWNAGKEKRETERLDRFLTVDPGLVQSLQSDEKSRRRTLAVAALLAGILLGALGVWLALSTRRAGPDLPALPAEETAKTLVSHGKSLTSAGRFPQAWSELRLATRLAPKMVEAWDALAISMMNSSQTEEAVRCWNRCLEIEPGYERALHGLGDMHFYSGRNREAEDYWLKAQAYRAVARLWLLEGRMQEAIPRIRKLADEQPDNPWVQVEVKAAAAGRLTPELRWRLEPGYLVSWNPETAKAWRLYYEGRRNEASAAFTKVLAQHPDDGSAMLGKGWSLYRTGSDSDKEALSYFERVLAKWPANYSALDGRGWCLKAAGQVEGALRSWSLLLEHRADSVVEAPDALKGIGMVYYERGDYARANSYLAKSLEKNSEDKETMSLLVETARKLSPP
jgi:Flp pilus assembly protein TadD